MDREINEIKKNIPAKKSGLKPLVKKIANKNKSKVNDEKYKTLFDTANYGIFILDKDFKPKEINSHIINFLGYTEDELFKMSLFDILLKEDLISSPLKLHEIEEKGYFVNKRFLKRKDDSIVFTEVTVRKLSDGSYFGIIRDITKESELQNRLIESEKILRTVLDNIPAGVFWKDRNCTFLGCNMAFAKDAGFEKPEDVIGKNDFDLTWDDKANYYINEDKKVMDSGIPKLFFLDTQTSYDGRTVYQLSSKVPLKDSSNNVIGVLGTYIDITEKKKIEKEYFESINKFRNVIENAPFGFHFYLLEDDGRLVFTGSNPAADKILGVENSQFIGKTIEEAFPPLEQTEIPAIYKRIAREGGTYLSSHVNYDDDVIKGAYDILVFQTFQNSMAVTFTDITSKKKMEQDKEKLLNELEIKNKEMERLVYIASHDLRSPLVSIQGFGQRLQKYYKELGLWIESINENNLFSTDLQEILLDKIPKSLNYINSSSVKMDSIINGLLKFSRTGRAPFVYQTISIRKLFENILSTMAFQILNSKAEIKLFSDHNFYCDSIQIQLALGNILDNALKYRSPERSLEIIVNSLSEKEYIIVSIKDNGLGIPENCYEKIFELFQRLDPIGSVAGEGLGLAQSKKIVEKHKGKIWVESEMNAGSTFFISLPQKNN